MGIPLSVIPATIYAGGYFSTKTRAIEDPNFSRTGLSYDEFRAIAKTGDLIFTAATHLKATIPRMYINSHWLHVGIVYVSPRDGSIWEWGVHRATEHLHNSENKLVDGPQFIPIERLFALTGCIGYKQIGFKPIDLSQAIKLKGLPFADYPSCLATGNLTSRLMTLISSHHGANCSHLVTLTYAQCGTLTLTQPLIKYTPQSFDDLSREVQWNVATSGIRVIYNCPTPLYIDIKKCIS